MATDITRKRLTTKGLQTRRLGGAIPRWELFSPEKGYSYGQFGMSEAKEKRLRAKAQATAAQRRKDINLDYRSLGPMVATEPSGKVVPVASQHFVFGRHGRAKADWNRILPYLERLGARIENLRARNQLNLLTPQHLQQITGIDVNRPGGWDFLATVVAAAEHPELLESSDKLKSALSDSFEKWQRGGAVNEELNIDEKKNLINLSSLSPEMKEWMKATNAGNLGKVNRSIADYATNFEKQEMEKELERRAKKWEGKHGKLAEQDYVEGLVGSGEYDRKESPHYQQAQKERREQNLDEYMARGQGTPSQKKRAKWRNPDLYAAGYPDGQQTEIPERKLIKEREVDYSKVPEVVEPDWSSFIKPQELEEARQKYDKDLDRREHVMMSLDRAREMDETRNDKILARQKAMQKETQQLLAENAWKDNLIMQRKLLKDKKKEYAKAKYQRSKERNKLGGHDFWNVLRGVGGSAADSVGSIGGITGSLAAANRALKQGPQDWRNM
jgi:hypothetical protein